MAVYMSRAEPKVGVRIRLNGYFFRCLEARLSGESPKLLERDLRQAEIRDSVAIRRV